MRSPAQSHQKPSGPPLARGATADIYPWEEGTVLKLFHRFSLEDVEYEARLARAVHESGIQAPRALSVIPFGEQYGLVYERVDGPSLMAMLPRKPWRICEYAQRLAALQVQIHCRDAAADLPRQRQRLERRIQRAQTLPPDVRDAALVRLAALPDGGRVCHGDFHPGNLLLTPKGDVAIDWIDSSLGNPLADVARTTILLLGAAAAENPFSAAFIRLYHAAYLRHYFRLRPGGAAEYRRWLPVVAAARLDESVPERVAAWLLGQAGRLIAGNG